eukprot:Phypoly_transcript_07828.p1 GENE.Phypoly_transcript_07828~~Phypoly_transcript_07828.p1  ORF type:complete len:452 (+),score=43.86 Phypoly_transcript_07828:156-1511(+)
MEIIKSVATSFRTCVTSSLKVYVPSRIYFGGDILEGIISLDISQPIDSSGIALTLCGMEKTKVNFNEKGKPPSKEEHIFLSVSKRYAITPEGSTGIPPGKYSFAFAFKLPPRLPATFKSEGAEIVYELKVNADVQPLFLLNDTVVLDIGGNIYDDTEFTSGQTPVHKVGQKDVFWGGTVQVEATLLKSNFYIGEKVPILVKIDNRSGQKVRGVRVEIKCEQTTIAHPFLQNCFFFFTLCFIFSVTGIRNSKGSTTPFFYKNLETFEIPVLKYSSQTETIHFIIPTIPPTTLQCENCNKNITWKCWLVLICDIKNAPDFELHLPVTIMRKNPHTNARSSEKVTCSHCQATIKSFRYKCNSCATSLCFECYQITPSVHPNHTSFDETSCIPESQIEDITYVDMGRDTTNKVLKALYPVGSEIKHFAGVAGLAVVSKVAEGVTMAALGDGFQSQ